MSGKMRFFYSFGGDTMHNKEASTPAKTFQGLIIAKSRAKIWPVKYVHVLFLLVVSTSVLCNAQVTHSRI